MIICLIHLEVDLVEKIWNFHAFSLTLHPTKDANMVKESKPYPSHIPGLPENWDELLECLKEGEEEIESGGGIPGEEVFRSIRERLHRYTS